ncbi:MAG: energy transducer TonB [Burkholderiaceae bacterium]|nr:energy transducer TonB [Burkholderiaceae bacterium]
MRRLVRSFESAPAGGVAALWRRDPLAFAIGFSIVLHALALALRFAPPAPVSFAPIDPQLEVVLVNAKTEARPLKPELLAQENLVGGGEHEHGRARSPLPAQATVQDGDAVALQRRRVAELEAQQRQLLALARGPQSYVQRDEPVEPAPVVEPGRDAVDVDAAVARLQAQIDRQVSDYNKRPKRLTYGVNATGVSYARYVDDWAERIERIGTERYPREARGRIYGTLIITVEIGRGGNVVDIVFNRKSKHEVLNRAVREIVLAGAPYERFTPEMARDGDILQIVRTWNFTNDMLQTASVRSDALAEDPQAPAAAPASASERKSRPAQRARTAAAARDTRQQ